MSQLHAGTDLRRWIMLRRRGAGERLARLRNANESNILATHYERGQQRRQASGGLEQKLKGSRDPCHPGKSIERHYTAREQVESQGGPCHMYTPPPAPAALPGAIAVSHVSAVSG